MPNTPFRSPNLVSPPQQPRQRGNGGEPPQQHARMELVLAPFVRHVNNQESQELRQLGTVPGSYGGTVGVFRDSVTEDDQAQLLSAQEDQAFLLQQLAGDGSTTQEAQQELARHLTPQVRYGGFSDLMRETFAPALSNVGLKKVATWQALAMPTKGGDHKHNGNNFSFAFSPYPIKPLAGGRKEIERFKITDFDRAPDGTRLRLKAKFWEKTWKKTHSFTEVMAKIPPWVIPMADRAKSSESQEWLKQQEVTDESGAVLLTLHTVYANKFLQFMDSELVRRGYALGFHPLILLQRAIWNQKELYGLGGRQVETCDLEGRKSYISFLGFYKYNGADASEENMDVIVLMDQNNRPLTLEAA